MVSMLSDVARFCPTDGEGGVEASFACPVCLRRPAESTLHAEPEDLVSSACTCGTEWLTLLDPDQTLRLPPLSPPAAPGRPPAARASPARRPGPAGERLNPAGGLDVRAVEVFADLLFAFEAD